MNTRPVLEWLAQHEPESIQRMIEWLRIPSISTDPAHADDCRRAAQWASDHLAASGFQSQLLDTGEPAGSGRPIVLATSPGDPEYRGPHVLFYGHYDVQPPDPLELWESPPFEPVIKPAIEGGPGERVIARGAVDDKGQVMAFLEAMRAWNEAGAVVAGGARITVLLEGEEESGSVNLERFLAQRADSLRSCDVCVISDTGMLGRGKPAITYGVRGLAYTEAILHAADQDLHSGSWGGKVPNPISELVKILAQLWDDDRRITIPGFYEGVNGPEAGERDAWKKLAIDESAALRAIGLPPEASLGETGFSFTEREWARPTAEINGIVGGYTGKGAKTVIPSHASAKVSFRLVDDQDPARITASFFAWLRERTPPGCRWDLIDHSGGPPATVATDSPQLRAASEALRDASGVAPAMIKTGGSIPVAGMLKSMLGMETIFMGFGLEDDRVHSPNEKFELDCFRLGARAHAMLIEKLWRLGA